MKAEYKEEISNAAQEQRWEKKNPDKECWHIIKLGLIAWIIALHLIILECPLGLVYDCAGRVFCVLFAACMCARTRVPACRRLTPRKLGWTGFRVEASIKFIERFSGLAIRFEKFAIALDGAAVEEGGHAGRATRCFLFWAADKKAPSKWNKWEIASAQLLFH